MRRDQGFDLLKAPRIGIGWDECDCGEGPTLQPSCRRDRIAGPSSNHVHHPILCWAMAHLIAAEVRMIRNPVLYRTVSRRLIHLIPSMPGLEVSVARYMRLPADARVPIWN